MNSDYFPACMTRVATRTFSEWQSTVSTPAGICECCNTIAYQDLRSIFHGTTLVKLCSVFTHVKYSYFFVKGYYLRLEPVQDFGSTFHGTNAGKNHVNYLWQSYVEIEDYSVTYFDSTAVFKLLYR